jgi:hypothetical protein
MNYAADMARDIAKGYAVRLDQKIRVVLKPKPFFLTEKMWVKLAAIFIYVEKTEPSMTITESGDTT